MSRSFAARYAWHYIEPQRRMIRAIALVVLSAIAMSARAQAQTPFFLYGATFFYERVPRDQWAGALRHYRAIGINTIDLYVMWNWHEPRSGTFDFTGRTNPRRDLVGLLKLIDADGFKIVLRPGPVIRNEWRNGGYPAWLLAQPAYHMPLRDVLEGRYPATATLQNAHSDAAAAQWMNNPLHMRYATRWLQRVLQTVLPWKRDIYAVALDDDQGAYIDNDTWPAPHFQRYVHYLASVVHAAIGRSVPVFINTYDMKVTAGAPVWAWGNWYQSDAYSIGEHDRAQLEFATGLLQTQPARPVMISEFQAGWLQDADEAQPRPADPTNTTLALHTLLQMGAHGVVNFPVQDTLNPAGWEAPWANAFYSWDAAFSVSLTPQARYAPTRRFGELVEQYGSRLAQTHLAADAAIAYLTSAYDPARIRNAEIAQIATATIQAQRGCHVMRITCTLVDLRFAPFQTLRQYRVLIVPPTGVHLAYVASVRHTLDAFSKQGGRIVSSARYAHVTRPAAGGLRDAALLVSNDKRFGFVDVVNYGRTPTHTERAYVHAGTFSAVVAAMTVPARDAVLVPLGLKAAPLPSPPPGAAPTKTHSRIALRAGSWIDATLAPVAAHRAVVYRADVYRDGYPAIVFENDAIRLIVSPCAGARALVFEDKAGGENLFTTIGGLRDAWSQILPPSNRDYIARYTHPIQTGTFNRCYEAHLTGDREATFSYHAPDAPPHGATFRKRITIDGARGDFRVALTASFPRSATQHAQELTSFAIGPATRIMSLRNGYGFFDQAEQRLVLVAWGPADALSHTLDRHEHDALLTLTFAPGSPVVRYGVRAVLGIGQAQAQLRAFANRP